MKNVVVFQKLPLPQAQPCLQMKTLALSPQAVLAKGKGRRFLTSRMVLRRVVLVMKTNH